MVDRVELLEALYQAMRRDKVKIEAKKFGFAVINELTAAGGTLDYGQMENNFIHKYRLLNLSADHWKKLLRGHVKQEYNACLYFAETANNTLCFNLDNNFKINNNELIPETRLAAEFLGRHLESYGLEPLTILSGRGYHLWCRFAKPLANQLLLDFMIRIAAQTLASLHYSRHDYHSVKINMSPHPQYVKGISIRAFGSKHIKTGSFSGVKTPDGILDEENSWDYFGKYLTNKTVSEEHFRQAYDELINKIPL